MMMKAGGGRGKGSAFERLVAKKFEEWSGSEVKRTPLSGGWAKTAKFSVKNDLISTDKRFPVGVECKKQEGWLLEHLLYTKSKVFSWWKQVTTETPKGKIPLLVFSKNRSPIYAMVSIEGWQTLTRSSSPSGIRWMTLRTKKTGKCYILLLEDFLRLVPYPKKKSKKR